MTTTSDKFLEKWEVDVERTIKKVTIRLKPNNVSFFMIKGYHDGENGQSLERIFRLSFKKAAKYAAEINADEVIWFGMGIEKILKDYTISVDMNLTPEEISVLKDKKEVVFYDILKDEKKYLSTTVKSTDGETADTVVPGWFKEWYDRYKADHEAVTK